MKFEQLFYFKEAVKYSSISIAAEKNYMSQSSVSYSILKLEKELGVELLKRTNSGVTPTHMGELVLKSTEEILRSMNDITEMAKEMRHSGEVHISCIPCLCDWIIPRALRNLKEKAADIILSVTTSESRLITHNVSSGISEFGILISYDGLERNTDIKYTPLFKDEYLLYVGKNSPYWDRESISYKELITQPYIAYRDEFRSYNGGLTDIFGTNKSPAIIFRTDDLCSIKNMITQNDYVAFFPRHMSQNDYFVQSGQIRRLPVSDKKLSFEVGYIESKKYKTPKIDKIVLEVIKDTVKEIIDKNCISIR